MEWKLYGLIACRGKAGSGTDKSRHEMLQAKQATTSLDTT
jgi:hypothetical protein